MRKPVTLTAVPEAAPEKALDKIRDRLNVIKCQISCASEVLDQSCATDRDEHAARASRVIAECIPALSQLEEELEEVARG